MSGQRHAKVALPAWQSTGRNCKWGKMDTGPFRTGMEKKKFSYLYRVLNTTPCSWYGVAMTRLSFSL